MKAKLFLTTISMMLFSGVVFSIPATEVLKNNTSNSTEIEKVKKTIVESYVQAIFLEGDAKLLEKGWHPDCDIVILRDGELEKLPAKYWINRLKKNPKPLDPSVTYKFIDVKVTGYAAIAIIEIFSDGKQVYTDYMCLYKFNDGWKIATKIYYAFPK